MADPDDLDPCACTRRDALLRGTVTLGALALGCAGRGGEVRDISSEGGVLRLALAEHPPLQSPGGAAIVRVDGKGKPLLIRNDGDQGITALSLKCTHLGCTVRVDEGGALGCPCHGSRFASDGAVTKGPAKAALTRYPAAIEGEVIAVKLA